MALKVKVWLGGEGASELGSHSSGSGVRGGIETLLESVQGDGWTVVGVTQWKRIRKLVVGAARGEANHGDIHNVAGLVLEAYEGAADLVAFTRDTDSDPDRESAIDRGIAEAARIFSHPRIAGGVAKPALEGWAAACLGVRDTDSMSRSKAKACLVVKGFEPQRASTFVDVFVTMPRMLPPGCDSLPVWLARVKAAFAALGLPASSSDAGGPG